MFFSFLLFLSDIFCCAILRHLLLLKRANTILIFLMTLVRELMSSKTFSSLNFISSSFMFRSDSI